MTDRTSHPKTSDPDQASLMAVRRWLSAESAALDDLAERQLESLFGLLERPAPREGFAARTAEVAWAGRPRGWSAPLIIAVVASALSVLVRVPVVVGLLSRAHLGDLPALLTDGTSWFARAAADLLRVAEFAETMASAAAAAATSPPGIALTVACGLAGALGLRVLFDRLERGVAHRVPR